MIDSCSPSKLDPGVAATYSIPRLLITSTMKSDAGFSTSRGDTPRGGGSVSARSCAEDGVTGAPSGVATGVCALAVPGALLTTSPAAPAAAPFRKRRRPTDGVV